MTLPNWSMFFGFTPIVSKSSANTVLPIKLDMLSSEFLQLSVASYDLTDQMTTSNMADEISLSVSFGKKNPRDSLFPPLKWRHNECDSVSNHQPLTIVYSTVYSGADQRKHQSSASLAFMRGIHHTRGQKRGKYFHLVTSSCCAHAWLHLSIYET